MDNSKATLSEKPLLLVLGIVQGRHFPRRVSHNLLVEAVFDGEVLVTDAVEHAVMPEFATELAWELTRKGLKKHRLRRTPIKVQVFAVNESNSKKEMVGYCLLDIRSTHQKPMEGVWRPLLRSKYRQLKPEIKCTLSLEDEKPAKEERQKVEISKPPEPVLSAELNEECGYYHIGTVSNGCRVFNWSVTIISASNLSQLIPCGSELRSEDGCSFSYSFLKNYVTTEKFFDFLVPVFTAERATVRLFATPENLHKYILQERKIDVLLCCAGEVLGSAVVVLKPLLSEKVLADASAMEPASIEGLFTLRPVTRNSTPSTLKNTDQRIEEVAAVRISVVLRNEIGDEKEDRFSASGKSPVIAEGGTNEYRRTEVANARKSDILMKMSPSQHIGKRQTVLNERTQINLEYDRKRRKSSENQMKNKQLIDNAAKPIGVNVDKQIDDTIEKTNRNRDKENHHQTRIDQILDGIHSNQKASDNTDTIHHFTVSIDVRSISELDVADTVNVICRYLYPFFGNSSPVETNTPVPVQRQIESFLPQSFCAFEFSSTVKLLQHTFTRVPLLIEIWHRDISQTDQLLGIAQVHLSKLLVQNSIPNVRSNQRVFNENVVVSSPESPARGVGKLHVIVGLEDHGKVKDKSTALHNTEINAKESAHMTSFANEWKKREKEREMFFTGKMEEYTELEKKLKLSVAEMEKRENSISHREFEVRNLRSKLEEEQQRQLHDDAELSNRTKEEFEHRVTLEQNKCVELENNLKSAMEEIESVDNRIRRQEDDICALRESQENNQEAKMREGINLVQLEKDDLVRKLDSVTRSKAHYKHQWGTALHEIAKIKQYGQDQPEVNLSGQQHEEMSETKLRFLVAEKKKVRADLSTEITRPKLNPTPKKIVYRPPPPPSISAQQNFECSTDSVFDFARLDNPLHSTLRDDRRSTSKSSLEEIVSQDESMEERTKSEESKTDQLSPRCTVRQSFKFGVCVANDRFRDTFSALRRLEMSSADLSSLCQAVGSLDADDIALLPKFLQLLYDERVAMETVDVRTDKLIDGSAVEL